MALRSISHAISRVLSALVQVLLILITQSGPIVGYQTLDFHIIGNVCVSFKRFLLKDCSRVKKFFS